MLAHLNEPKMSVDIHYSIFSTHARVSFALKNVFVFVFKKRVCVIKNRGRDQHATIIKLRAHALDI